jgi:predicted ATP-grasp superfamily ATP-dependent carboligase
MTTDSSNDLPTPALPTRLSEVDVEDCSAWGVVGVSARAAVQSLLRAGFQAWAVDLFGDADLRRWADVQAVAAAEYPQGLAGVAVQRPRSRLLYTGGLENYPELLAALAEVHHLVGNGPATVRDVRDPWLLASRFPEVFPPTIAPGQVCPSSGRWLNKPVCSGGGVGIRWAYAGEIPGPDRYLQLYVRGVSASAVCWDGRCLGVTRQWHGCRWLHSAGLLWCGNIGPWIDDPPLLHFCRLWCQRLHQAFGLVGLWGFDLIRGAQEIRIVEINPRYPASAEVLEWAYHHPLLRGHWPDTLERITPQWRIAKAIYYAPWDLVFPPSGPWQVALDGSVDPWRWSGYADIPPAGTLIPQGRPVLTLLVRAPTEWACVRQLRLQVAQLDALLVGSSGERCASEVSL